MDRSTKRMVGAGLGVGLAASALAATGVLGSSGAAGNAASVDPYPARWGPTLACNGIADRDRALYAGCIRFGKFRAANDDRDGQDRYDERDRREYDGRSGHHRKRDRHRGYDREKRDYADGYYFGVSPYQEGWVEGLLAGSDDGADFMLPYGAGGHPYVHPPQFAAGAPGTDPGKLCTDPSTGANYPCPSDPRAPSARGAPSAPAPGAPTAAPGPASPGAPSPTTTPSRGPALAPRPAGPPPGVFVPPAVALPSEGDSGPSAVLLLLVFLASAGSVGTAYLVLLRRRQSPPAGG